MKTFAIMVIIIALAISATGQTFASEKKAPQISVASVSNLSFATDNSVANEIAAMEKRESEEAAARAESETKAKKTQELGIRQGVMRDIVKPLMTWEAQKAVGKAILSMFF